MTIDELVAKNVKRLRGEAGLSVGEFARRLGVSRALAYDMERSRKDRTQRKFSWDDLVRLCGALEVTIFELVLPSRSGVEVKDAQSLAPWMGGHVDGSGSLFLNLEQFSKLLFGQALPATQLDGFGEWSSDRWRRNAELRDELQALLDRYEEAGPDN